MKHKTLRTLLCVILTVCFCLSAIAPVSAAGLFSGDSGAASIFDEWIRSLKDRFTEIQPGNDATPVANEGITGNDFIRIFHLDCGRRYFSVDEINGIIDELAANHYTHIELGFGNDGFRFLLDETDANGNPITITANGTTYNLSGVNTAIHSGNVTYSNGCSYTPDTHELTQSDMDEIISHANDKGIGIIPLMDIPGHSNALIDAMNHSSINLNVTSHTTGENIYGVAMRAFEITDTNAVSFVTALAEKYIDYFASKGCKYFNLGADECGYTLHNNYIYGQDEYLALAKMLNTIGNYIVGKSMTPMVFNDGFRSTNGTDYLKANLSEKFVVCYWTESGYTKAAELATKFKVVNTHNGWYYVIGNDNGNWASYKTAENGVKNIKCTSCDSGYTTNYGCMFAVWCDDPSKKPDYESRIYPLIRELASNNTDYFTAPVTPVAPTITASKTTLTVGNTATLSISTGAAATWSVDNTDVVELSAAVTAAGETVTATAKAKGTAMVSADVGGTALSVTLTVNEPGEVTWEHEQTITVTVNNTVNIEISGVNYSGEAWETDDPTIATVVSVTGKDAVEAKEVYTATEVTYSTLAKNAKNNQDWIKTDYYYKKNNDHYPVYVKKERSKNTTYYYYGFSVSDSAYAVEAIGNKTSESSQTVTVYTKTSTDAVPASTTFAIKGLIAGKSTSIVIGNTKYTINVIAEDLSSVTPLPIQLWITNNTIEGSGTNAKTTDSGWGGDSSLGGARYISVPATTANATSSVYSEAGMLVVDAFAAAGMTEPLTRYEWGGTRFITAQEDKAAQDLVFWTGRIHNSTDSNIQKVWGDDYSTSGDAFTYVRYYGKTWSVSADGVNWTDVTGNGSTGTYSNCKQQLAAYYMTRTKITDEVTTDVADWGKPEGSSDYTSQVSTDFVLLDFTVKYEDGTRSPNTFPVSNKTLAYHCEDKNAACGTDSSGNRYRMLNNFRAVNTSDFEVYMVTVTMTNDAATGEDSDGNSVTLTANQAQNGYEYTGVEQIVWAIDEETRANSKLDDYAAISGSTTYSGCKIGGDPYVRGVEIYNNHGALITYYIRAKEVEGNLIVHYLDRSAGDKEFYSYNIVVIGDTVFDKGFAQVAENSTALTGNTVTNKYDVTQTVSADLTTMPAIPAQYRYVDYTCVEVVRSEDGKEVFLYYTFDADVSFVVDFGLPLTIPYTALNENLSNPKVEITKITKGTAKYGTLSVNGTESITYTPTQTIDTNDSFNVTCTGTIPVQDETTGETKYQQGEVTYTVYIIPATNVLYEENFITNPENSGWTNAGTADSVNQTLEEAGNKQNVYGYDTQVENYYLGDDDSEGKGITYSMSGAYKATLAIPEGKDFVNTLDKLTFTFKGTGYDLISGCGANTGMLTVNVLNSAGKRVKTYVVDTYLHGDETIMPNGTITYQVPVVRNMSLTYDTYTVTVYGSLWDTSGAVTKPENPTPTIPTASTASLSMDAAVSATVDTNSVLRDMLDACGLADVSLDEVELVYMDENSILNGGTGAAEEPTVIEHAEKLSSMNAASLTVEGSETAQAEEITVWVDAFRVYNPLGTAEVQAYTDDKEAGVSYSSLYDYVKANKNYVTQNDKAVMYIEYNGSLGIADIASYKNWGPENEIYLAPGTAIAFGLATSGTDSIVQISAKVVSGDPTIKIGDDANITLNATEMYYDLKTNNRISRSTSGDTYVVIENNSEEGVLAVSGLKLKNAATDAISETTKVEILKSFAAKSSEDFEPTVFEVSVPQTARKNRNFAFGVSASANDVQSVTIQMVSKDDTDVNGEIFTLTPSNTKAVASGFASNYSYSKVYKVKEAGTYTFAITAYGEGGSKTITKTVVVK